MRKQEKLRPPDGWIAGTVILLVVLGVLLVFDASYAKTADASWAHNDALYFVKKQLAFALAGLVAMFVVSRVRLVTLQKLTLPVLAMSLLLLVAVLVPHVGHLVNGARRWIKAGPISVQPSEIAKLALILYLAGVFARRKKMIRSLDERWLLPMGIIAVAVALVVKEPDLGTAVAILIVCFAMAFAAGARKRHLLGMLGMGGALGCAAVMLKHYRMERIQVWLNPWKDQYGDGYQVIHSLLGLGTGGWLGLGLCEGREKTYIPAASTDFIFSTLGEEAGLIGGLVLLGIFVFLIYRGLDLARRCKSTYASLLVVGITSMIGMQALVNVAVVTASIPATGVPLPFISYGGSSLVLMLAGVGVMLAVSRQVDVDLGEQESNEGSSDRRRNRRTHLSGHKRGTSASRRGARRGSTVRR